MVVFVESPTTSDIIGSSSGLRISGGFSPTFLLKTSSWSVRLNALNWSAMLSSRIEIVFGNKIINFIVVIYHR